jgi:RNase H-fold protein (predicted Holliday junction resolvase)
MAKIIIKTVGGRKYRYERISTKRRGSKVVTEDKYLGPVVSAKRGKIEQAPEGVRRRLRVDFELGTPMQTIIADLKEAGIRVSESTVRNYMKREGKQRLPLTNPHATAIAEGHTKRREQKAAKQRTARSRVDVLLADEAITTADALAMMSGDVDEHIAKLLWGKEKKKRAAARRRG